MGEIVFSNVSKTFEKIKAVDHVNFTVTDGEFLTLLGPSGCGKSTTLNLIAGMLLPTTGEIYINKKLMNNIPANKRNIGLVFQSYALFPHMTVFENVAFGLKMKKFPKVQIPDKVQAALHLVNMNGYEERKPSELSGGQQQRIALARALVFNPDVLLLDEPLSNLDAKLRENVGFEIKQLHAKTKKTIVFVTHDQIEALTMSDRIILMNQGCIEQVGTPFELYSSPKTLFSAGFIGTNSFIECTVLNSYDDSVEVEFKGLMVKGKGISNGDFLPGAKVILSIRPENVRLVNSANEKEFQNILEGKIINVIFRGADILLYLDVQGVTLKIKIVNSGMVLDQYKLNERIAIGFNDCIIFKNFQANQL
jgi:iron(III) transport system ATP-binding protein